MWTLDTSLIWFLCGDKSVMFGCSWILLVVLELLFFSDPLQQGVVSVRISICHEATSCEPNQLMALGFSVDSAEKVSRVHVVEYPTNYFSALLNHETLLTDSLCSTVSLLLHDTNWFLFNFHYSANSYNH